MTGVSATRDPFVDGKDDGDPARALRDREDERRNHGRTPFATGEAWWFAPAVDDKEDGNRRSDEGEESERIEDERDDRNHDREARIRSAIRFEGREGFLFASGFDASRAKVPPGKRHVAQRAKEASAIVADGGGLFVAVKKARRFAIEHGLLGGGTGTDVAMNRGKYGHAEVGAAPRAVVGHAAGEKFKRLRSLAPGTDDGHHRGK